jgi:GxxExxY protein
LEYEEALKIDFDDREIPFISKAKPDVFYIGKKLSKRNNADFICYDQFIIEIRAMDGLIDVHLSQILNYLKATGLRVGLMINFGTSKLQ